MNTLDILKFKQKGSENIEGGLITFINPFSYLFYRKNLELFAQFDYLLIDGIALVKLLKLVGIKTSRYSFDMTSLAPIVFENAIERNRTIYFIGSSKESINNFIGVIETSFRGLNIIGFRDGFFSGVKEKEDALDDIVSINPDIVVVGMGTPLQEMFLVNLKNKGWNGTGYTCGGFIHQTINRSSYYPKFYDKYNVRWLYRIFDEPHLAKRYLLLYPKSVLLFFLDYIRSN